MIGKYWKVIKSDSIAIVGIMATIGLGILMAFSLSLIY